MANGKVTQKDLYEAINEMRDSMDNHFDSIRRESLQLRQDMLGCYEANAKRIGFLELWRAEIIGKMAIISSAVSVILISIWEFIRRKLFD